jgi:hypothetical protein
MSLTTADRLFVGLCSGDLGVARGMELGYAVTHQFYYYARLQCYIRGAVHLPYTRTPCHRFGCSPVKHGVYTTTAVVSLPLV